MPNQDELSSKKEEKNVENKDGNVAKENLKLSVSIPSLTLTMASELSNTVTESPITSLSSSKEDEINPWTYNHYAKNYAIGLITVLYASILIVYAIMLALWQWVNDKFDKEVIAAYHKHHTQFNYYICVVSYIFFGYCYIVLLSKNQKCQSVIRFLRQKLFRQKVEENDKIFDNSTLMPNVGCLYLRLGAVLFAMVAAVFYTYTATLKTGYFQANVLKTIFIIIQTHFVYCSSTLFDPKHYIICRFGTMHLAAINIVTVFQFVFAKGQSNGYSIGKAYKYNKTTNLIYVPVFAPITTTTMNSYAINDSLLSSNEEQNVHITNTYEPILNRIVRATAYAGVSDDGLTETERTEAMLGKFKI
uniref:Uncharacterized protein n=1 Tax=Panagrolaimus sp. ES5 TaxID=591445 RepID=A0AC34FZ66_9BILA